MISLGKGAQLRLHLARDIVPDLDLLSHPRDLRGC